MKMVNGNYLFLSLVAAITATFAATIANGLNWPVWAMFVGWVAFFTGKDTFSGVLATFGCLAFGLIAGNLAGLAIGSMAPKIGFWAIAPVVFVVAFIVVSLRGLSVMNNITAYFLGLITFFAAHISPGISSTISLVVVTALGLIAAYCTASLQRKLTQRKTAVK
tara:strand:+ start:4479 stop:4970 length:492 start_codon:yes stop_codon:yes gene_type:complete